MKTTRLGKRTGSLGFTLIEMLVVIGIIIVLAGMIFPVGSSINRAKIRAKVRAELVAVETAIENYKTKLGHYPPDSGNVYQHQLYYELVGTTLDKDTFTTLDGSATIGVTSLESIFGSKVAGFINCSRPSGEDEVKKATDFLKGVLKPGQTATFTNGFVVLTCSVRWPLKRQEVIIKGYPEVNPWRYNSSNPTNNPSSYDLWVDVDINGKLFRFSNWSDKPVEVSAP